MRGRNKPWAKDFIAAHEELAFKKDEVIEKPKTLEIGIGKGDFILQNAKYNPDYIHIGVELNTSIYAIAMKKIVNDGVDNIRLLNVEAKKLNEIIPDESIDKLYLNFSDPWPQNGYRKRRLVHPVHLMVFEQILKNNGEIIMKTDNDQLFEMAVTNFKKRNYQVYFEEFDYQTIEGDFVSEYEAKFRGLGQKIHRICAVVDKGKLQEFGETLK